MCSADGVKTKLSRYSLTKDTHRCPSVYYGKNWNRRRDRSISSSSGCLDGIADRNPNLNDRTIPLKVWKFYGEGRHVRVRGRES
jgi:hypothetical protein